ncbi:asparaginase domain-containing protein [Cyclobacterium roseum]|uniref:asparaginase domain-containing protein n=1 Tax=Cyclobacterium roseum TaxID=2666137 RepID=UPI00139071F1|nr:asparaginase domain-containing protein [Cyclobacterium roseum]
MQTTNRFSICNKFVLFLLLFICYKVGYSQEKPRLAIFSGPTATIQNSYPLITSNKAREENELPLLTSSEGEKMPFDRLYYQRIAAPVTVYVEMFTAHPLESDVKELYGAPDGYVGKDRKFRKTRRDPSDKPVLKVELKPEDGLYPLPYMAVQTNGKPWDATSAYPGSPFSESRQTFYPNASRIFEEIERAGGNIYGMADFDFYRPAPAGGYTKGLAAEERTDNGEGDIPPETLGKDFFTYGPYGASQNRMQLAKATNMVQRVMESGDYDGSIWLEGSPSIENTSYWMGLLIDSEAPLVFNAAQRMRGLVSADGDQNIIDGIHFITSGVWADEKGVSRIGSVMIQDQIIFSSREVQKGDARPGGYVITGGYGGIIGSMGYGPKLTFLPLRKHTHLSEVNFNRIPESVPGITVSNEGSLSNAEVAVKDENGDLIPESMPMVTIYKSARWKTEDDGSDDPASEVDILARIQDNLSKYPLAGFVGEGMAPYGSMISPMDAALELAALHGYPVLKAARGNADGFMDTNPDNLFIEGHNTTSTKGRVLLMACILRFGTYPPAKDPSNPTPEELDAIKEKIKLYQEVFHTH